VSLFGEVDPSKAKLTVFRDNNRFIISYTVSANSLRQILLQVAADSSTRSSHNALYESRSS